MGDRLRRFEREAKAGAARGQPICKHAPGRQLAEGVVHFDRVQLSCIAVQELLSWNRLRIEPWLSARMCPTGGANGRWILQVFRCLWSFWNLRDLAIGRFLRGFRLPACTSNTAISVCERVGIKKLLRFRRDVRGIEGQGSGSGPELTENRLARMSEALLLQALLGCARLWRALSRLVK